MSNPMFLVCVVSEQHIYSAEVGHSPSYVKEILADIDRREKFEELWETNPSWRGMILNNHREPYRNERIRFLAQHSLCKIELRDECGFVYYPMPQREKRWEKVWADIYTRPLENVDGVLEPFADHLRSYYIEVEYKGHCVGLCRQRVISDLDLVSHGIQDGLVLDEMVNTISRELDEWERRRHLHAVD